MKYIYIMLFCLIPFLSLTAQNKKMGGKTNVNGQWTGTITQDEGGYKTEYNYEVYLVQKGQKITGRAYVSVADIFAVMELKGELKGGGFMLFTEETKIVDSHKTEDMEWCLKKSQLILKYENDVLKLEGFWSGESELGACVPGKIFLTKQVPRA